jgi:hypothetical protein
MPPRESGDGMPKECEPQDGQYQLNLQVEATFQQPNTVVSFVDSATRDIRRDALERLKRSGIFQLPRPSIR